MTQPNSDVTRCAEVGEAGDASTCQARLDECTTSCGRQMCQRLASACHDDASGDDKVGECHDIGHDEDAESCFEQGVECLELCRDAH